MRINIQDVTEKDFSDFCDLPVTDCHTHVNYTDEIFHVEALETRYRIDKINVLAITSYDEKYKANNPMCLLFKMLFPGRVSAFASLYYPLTGAPHDGMDFLGQVKRYMNMGFDGMKMMEGKPDTRKRIGIPLDSPVYDLYYEYLEANGIPLLYHVNDPAIFWDKEHVPAFVIERKWAYLNDSFQTKEGIYTEVEGILKKFPKLKVIFAHFYFMDEEGIERASDFLDRWPEVSFDLAPGMHFPNFEKNLNAWRDFFVKYQDRIIFGTDNDYGAARQLIYTIRTVLETDNEIEYWDTLLHGMKLDRDALDKIYRANFQRYTGITPKAVNAGLVREDCARMERMAQDSPLKDSLLKDIEDIKRQLDKLSL